MSSQDGTVSAAGTTSTDYSESYYDHYYDGVHRSPVEEYRWESQIWRDFFTSVADRVIGIVDPETVLDVGCAKGMLVQAFASRGVDARGFDISDSAIDAAHEDVRERLSVASATSPIAGQYTLICCIEVLEHLAAEDAQKAIDVMCAATDRVLFSSSPGDFEEPTHINTQPTAQWAAWFAERGFYRRVDADLSFLTSWAVLFERADLSRRSIVERYEQQYAPLNREVIEKRHALLNMNRELSALRTAPRHVELDDVTILARHAELTARDNVMGLEARIAQLEAQVRASHKRIQRLRSRLEDRDDEVSAIRQSRTWKIGKAIVSPASRLRR